MVTINGYKIEPRADLQGANLQGANLQGANLLDANLRYANLQGANLLDANLLDANLRYANLQGANLQGANLQGANLRYANLRCANLRYANLRCADLQGATLLDADLRYAKNIPAIIASQLFVPPQEGPFIAFKKLQGGVIAKLLIPADAKRSSATTRKCRASHAYVLEGNGYSTYNSDFKYAEGVAVKADHWEEDRWIECAGGIHFFMTREEAEAY
jgi:hypothetical protein